jgi:hypothetical protein
MLEAEISLIFGLTLMELVELVAIATIISGGAAAIGIMLSTTNIIKSRYENNHQKKVSSATLILDLLKPWREEDVPKLLNEIADPNIAKYDEEKLEKLLNHLEDIATFWKDGTLSETHVKEFFGSNLKSIRGDKFIQDYIKKWNDKNPNYYFVNLKKLIKKVEDWKI